MIIVFDDAERAALQIDVYLRLTRIRMRPPSQERRCRTCSKWSSHFVEVGQRESAEMIAEL